VSDPKAPVDLKALQKQVALLEADLTPTGLADPRSIVEWRAAKSADRTAATFETWLGERVTQTAVAWVLATVFVRFCEDNRLIEYPFVAGPVDENDVDRTALARDLQGKFYEEHPEKDDRGWLEAAFAALSVSPVAAGLFDRRHNPMWLIQPTPFAIKVLLDFWRQTGEDGEILYDFTDPTRNTRFLGDLYQDLSESARKTYALLQTPEFVEEFILKFTLDPAIEEFGLEPDPPHGHEGLPKGLRVIDPACGSGHFLLGAFRRLLSAWETASPTTDRYDLVAKALSSVHGVDKNPFAAAIARFRLMLAAMGAAGLESLTEKVDFPINIAVGDSLLHGDNSAGTQGEFDIDGKQESHTYRTEDIDDYIKSVHMLAYGSYHAVFANPPYITVKDKAESDRYRGRYKTCHQQYSLSVPFAERIFRLAIRGTIEGNGAGYTGQITANSFMKREFGKKLIEDFFTQVDLTYIVDSSGAYIPAHGTPTVILIGRWRFPRPDSTIRAVLGVRGEPSQPAEPANGLVWRAIESQITEPGSESEWLTVVDSPRDEFAAHPWSLSGGGASGLMTALSDRAKDVIGDRVKLIGRTTHTGSDEAYFAPIGTWQRHGVSADHVVPLVEGDVVRDWHLDAVTEAVFPYDADYKADYADRVSAQQLWSHRTQLRVRREPGGTHEEIGLTWYEWSRWHPERFVIPLGIAMAFVATHNHFVLDRGGKVFKQSAPVIKLPESATEDDHLALLGVLNSSAACFWLKQVSQAKAGTSNTSGGGDRWSPEPWIERYEFTGTKLEEYPLPADLPLERGRELDSLAQQLAAVTTCDEDKRLRTQMIALQEELDWDVYHRYGLLTDAWAVDLIAYPETVPNLNLGERAFEIVMARKMERGELETQWFARHRSTPVTEIPKDWPEPYRRVVERRIEVIESDRNIGLIERPECKRRWRSYPWEEREAKRLTTWLLDRCEDRSLWFDSGGSPRPMTVNRLADRLRTDQEVAAKARELKGQDADLADILKEIIAEEHVPFLAAYRYKSTGLAKRAQWERTWDLQREEDRTGKRLDIPVPSKYQGTDFQKQSYWRHRGKLDVSKERFIGYPGASPDSDKDSLLIGWAGWDHKDQATALITLIEDRSTTDGWDTSRLTPLLAGLQELMPWLHQWHNEIDPSYGQSYADAYDAYLTAQREQRNLTEETLRTWTPPQSPRGHRMT
jgi:hypothetical protein